MGKTHGLWAGLSAIVVPLRRRDAGEGLPSWPTLAMETPGKEVSVK